MSQNKSQHVVVSKCDNGPLIFQVEKNRQLDWSNGWSRYVRQYSIDVVRLKTFASRNILAAIE